MTMKQHSFFFLAVVLSIFTLNGCGGSDASSVAEVTTPVSNPSRQPQALNSRSLSGASVLSRESISAPTFSYDATSIKITHVINDGSSVPHYQFFLNVDDNTSTGFSFTDTAWGQIGADYLIEDGDLYKSMASYLWNWDMYEDAITTEVENNSFSVTINRSLLPELSSKISLGFMVRDENWNVTDFYPQSSQMASFFIDESTSTDTEAPMLSLNGSDAMRLTQGSAFHDPGVYAYDNVDGDISDTAVSTYAGDITENVGTSSIIYTVSDSAGNTSTIERAYTVIKSEYSGIVVDANTDDWANIDEVASNSTGIIKVENNYGYLNILIQAPEFGENTQIFIDVDNDSTTGMQFLGGDWDFGGADYMVENRDLNKSTNPYAWSWDYGVAPIHYIKKGGVIEIAILKSSLENLGNTINVGFVNRDSNWNISHEMLPATGMVTYTLTSAYAQVPTDIRSMLCDLNQNIPVEVRYSLEDGFISNGKNYFSEELIAEGRITLNIYSQEVGTTESTKLLSFDAAESYALRPIVPTVNGSVFFSIRPTGLHPRDSSRNTYRFTDQNEVIEYGTNGPYVGWGKSLGFVGNTYFVVSKPLPSVIPKAKILGHSEITNENIPFYSEEFGAYPYDPVFNLRAVYKNGIIYYSYTPGQLVISRILTNVGTNVIGVIDDNSGLKPVSSCDNVNDV